MAGFMKMGSARFDAPPPIDTAAAAAVSAGLGVSAAMGRLLYRRGCRTADEARAFIRMEDGVIHDPFLLPDMRAAVDKILSALALHKKIAIFGDYDADGVTSVSVLYLFLSELGADVIYRIPRRSEGYGMTREALSELAERGAELIITVDTGTTATEEIAYAYELGLEVVVTDHHECADELPRAAAVVNPQRHDSEYPFSGLAGVGVVYKLVAALESSAHNVPTAEATMRVSEKYIDLVAIGTIADVMPVLDENRIIISRGLSKIENTNRTGLRALIEADAADAGRGGRAWRRPKITSGYISFTLAPRINAAGRMDDASLASELFLSTDPARAAYLAGRLCEINRERQRIENEIAAQAIEKIEADPEILRAPVIVVADDGWQKGIIGIVASRVTEKYGRPSILVSFEGDGGEHDVGRGSGRSVKGFDLAASLAECDDCLIRHGGHELAAGLSVERGRLDESRARINGIASEKFAAAGGEISVTADDVLDPAELTVGFADEIHMLEPFGVGNPTPLFIMKNARVASVLGVGGDKHTRLTFASDGASVSGICFSVSPEATGVGEGDVTDVLFNLDVNEFRGERSVQLVIRGIREGEAVTEKRRECERIYAIMRSGGDGDRPEFGRHVPDRGELALVYRAVRASVNSGKAEFSAEEIAEQSFGKESDETVKTKLALDIFAEMDILSIITTDSGTYIAAEPKIKRKADLQSSVILGELRRRYSV